MPEDEDEDLEREICDECGAEGDEGDLGLDEDGICEECRDNAEWRRQLQSDYRSSVL